MGVSLEDQSGKVQAPFCTQGWGWGVSQGETWRDQGRERANWN